MAKRQRYVKLSCTLCDTSKIFSYYTKCNVFKKEPELTKLVDLLNLSNLCEFSLKHCGLRPYKENMYLCELTTKPESKWNCVKDPVSDKIMDGRQAEVLIIISKFGYVLLTTKSWFKVYADNSIEVFSTTGGKSHTVKVTENLVLNESF